MAQSAAVILLSEVRALRERASRAREVARGMYQPDVIELLEQFAREFEQRAKELEAQVHELGRETAARTGQIAAELSGTLGKTAAKVGQIQRLQRRIAKIGDRRRASAADRSRPHSPITSPGMRASAAARRQRR